MEQVQRLNAAVYWLTYSPFLQPFTVKPKTAEDLKPEAERIKVKQCALCPKPDDTPVPPDLGPGGLLYGLGELFRLHKPDLSSLFTRTTGGRTLSFLKKNALEQAIQLVGEEVHRQYILTFQPKSPEPGQVSCAPGRRQEAARSCRPKPAKATGPCPNRLLRTAYYRTITKPRPPGR